MGPSPRTEPGDVHGRLTVIAYEGIVKKRRYYRCLCQCGNETVVPGKELRNGHTKSCGCLKAQTIGPGRLSVHGQASRSGPSPTYQSWYAMKQRCSNENTPAFHCYGGRGITVCERWLTFENFLADMGERPENLTLDRIDVDGNYEPNNCRWATHAEQSLNRRRSPWYDSVKDYGPRECAHCGAAFTARTPTGRFCSAPCKSRWHRVNRASKPAA